MRADVKHFLRDSDRGRLRRNAKIIATSEDEEIHAAAQENEVAAATEVEASAGSEGETVIAAESYIDRERRDSAHDDEILEEGSEEERKDRMVDVVLSDMCEPWEQTAGFYKRSISDPYRRLMNTSGNNFRDHVGSMVSGLISVPPRPLPRELILY